MESEWGIKGTEGLGEHEEREFWGYIEVGHKGKHHRGRGGCLRSKWENGQIILMHSSVYFVWDFNALIE